MARSSKHFTVEQLAEGVYAVIASMGGAAVGNAGIVDLGDRTLVFDTCMTPQAGQDLHRAALELTGREPSIIVNSHYHNDHIWGNQVFDANALICCTRRTLELMRTEGQEELRWARETAAPRLEDARRRYEEAADDASRRDALTWMGYFGGLVADLPTLEVRLPDVTFEERLTIHGPARSAELLAFENAHTGSDAILILRSEGIVFAGDLLFVDCHPYLDEGDLDSLKLALREIDALGATALVPGHGAVGSARHVAANLEYVDACLETAQRLVAAGDTTPERIEKEPIPELFESWELRRFYWANLKSLSGKLGATRTGA